MKELIKIQSELKAPKSQYNSFGKYKYRNVEDILEAVKPLLAKNGCILTLSDEVVPVASRIYIKATATVSNSGGATISTTAYAREEETKKGMDASQITGTASSYARKYALNGLFCIDDTKDADNMNNNGDNNAGATTQYTREIQQALNAAVADVNAAATTAEVKKIWKELYTLQQYPEFKNAVLNKGQLLKDKEAKA